MRTFVYRSCLFFVTLKFTVVFLLSRHSIYLRIRILFKILSACRNLFIYFAGIFHIFNFWLNSGKIKIISNYYCENGTLLKVILPTKYLIFIFLNIMNNINSERKHFLEKTEKKASFQGRKINQNTMIHVEKQSSIKEQRGTLLVQLQRKGLGETTKHVVFMLSRHSIYLGIRILFMIHFLAKEGKKYDLELRKMRRVNFQQCCQVARVIRDSKSLDISI